MKSNPVADEKELVNLLISWISRQDETPTRNEVEKKAQQIAGIFRNLKPIWNLSSQKP